MKKARNSEIIKNEIIDIINEIRPYLNIDGGDITFIKYENGVVYIKLFGECSQCLYQDTTINEGILLMLQERIPEITNVINVQL